MTGSTGQTAPGRWDRLWPIGDAVLVAVAAKAVMLFVAFLVLDSPADFWHRMATNWDGQHYLDVARHGYQLHLTGPGESVAFAFGYPMLLRLLGGSEPAALLLNNAASIGAVAVIAWHWGPRPASALALFPPFLVFGTVAYSEGLYVLLAAAALALADRGRPLIGGLAAALATTTRFMGGPALLVAFLPWGRWRTLRDWLGFGLVALTGVGILAYLWLWTGQPFGYLEAQKPWGAALAWPWEHLDWLLHGWFTQQAGPVSSGNLTPVDTLVRDVVFSLPVVAGIVLLFRRPGGTSAAVYSLVVFLAAISTVGTPAASLPRFLVAAFPAIAILGERVHSPGLWAAYGVGAVAVAVGALARHLFGFWS